MMTPSAHFMAQRGNSPVLKPSFLNPAYAPEKPEQQAAVAVSDKLPARVDERSPERAGKQEKFWGEDGFSFGDLIDIINPLQHIPVVATLYRAATGDQISPGARLAGGALVGGPIGFVAAVVNALSVQETGKDVGETVVASLTAPKSPAPPPTPPIQVALAAAEPEPEEIEIAMAAVAPGKPLETMALGMARSPSERLRGPQSEPEQKISERLRGPQSEMESRFLPLPARPGHARAVQSSAPALQPLPGMEAVAPGAEPIFPGNDGRELVDWYREERAALTPDKMQALHAQYERAKMLSLTQQAGFDLKT